MTRLIICSKVSSSEISTSQWRICPIFFNLGLWFNNLNAEIRVIVAFFITKVSNLCKGLTTRISSSKKSLKNHAFSGNSKCKTSKSGQPVRTNKQSSLSWAEGGSTKIYQAKNNLLIYNNLSFTKLTEMLHHVIN